MFPHSVSTRRRVHASVHTLKDRCLHTFWLRKSCLCVTLYIWHLVCHIISHRCSRNKVTSRLLNLRTLLTMQLLTYKDVSVRKLSHRRTCVCVCVCVCVCATCHIIYYVLSRSSCFHALCRLRDVFMVCSRTVWIRKTCICVTFNTWHLVCQMCNMLDVTHSHVFVSQKCEEILVF